MIHIALQSRSISLRKMLLFCGIVVGLMAGFASAQENVTGNYTCTGAELATESGSYASMAFCLPPEVMVEAEGINEANYSSGSEVAASMLLDGNRVELHLLYPCQPPQGELDPANLKPYLEAYDPVFTQAVYNESITAPILIGQIGNLKFVANQRNQTLFLVTADMNLSDETWGVFLDNLMISINEGVAPASNCPGTISPETSSNETVSTASEVAAEVAAAMEEMPDNETIAASPSEPETIETTEETIATGKDKMNAGMEAAQAQIKKAMEDLKKR
jgi:hypothetical protein